MVRLVAPTSPRYGCYRNDPGPHSHDPLETSRDATLSGSLTAAAHQGRLRRRRRGCLGYL